MHVPVIHDFRSVLPSVYQEPLLDRLPRRKERHIMLSTNLVVSQGRSSDRKNDVEVILQTRVDVHHVRKFERIKVATTPRALMISFEFFEGLQ